MTKPDKSGGIKMTNRTGEISPLVYARVAGLIGIIALVSGSFSIFVDSKLIVSGDAITTSNNIIASESLFRLGFVSSLIMQTASMFYAMVLYKLLKPVNKDHAMLMVILLLVAVPIFILNQLNQFAALPLAADQMHAQMTLFLDLHQHGVFIAGIFFGLWLLPLGFLVFKSGYLPRFLGVFLMIGCFGYLIRFFQAFLFPGSEATIWTNPALVFTHLSELSLMFWLLIKGVNVEQWEKRVAASAKTDLNESKRKKNEFK
jgi:hypothetical protein